MASKSTSSDSSSTDVKLVWNSPLDSEETFEVKIVELKTTLIKDSIYYCVSHSIYLVERLKTSFFSSCSACAQD